MIIVPHMDGLEEEFPVLLDGKEGSGPPSPGFGSGIKGILLSSGVFSGKEGSGPPSPGFGSGMTGKTSDDRVSM